MLHPTGGKALVRHGLAELTSELHFDILRREAGRDRVWLQVVCSSQVLQVWPGTFIFSAALTEAQREAARQAAFSRWRLAPAKISFLQPCGEGQSAGSMTLVTHKGC